LFLANEVLKNVEYCRKNSSIRSHNQVIETKVKERTQELIKTQKELKQASRLADIGTLAATVAHELRNPLGVINFLLTI